jgi:small subunit ribosomal protein S4e
MATSHLKRHSMPKSWPIKRKNITFTTKPNPGSYKRKYTISALVLLKEILGYAHTTKEAKFIVNNEEILVNGRKVEDIKFPIGLFEIVEIIKTKEKYMILFNTVGKVKIVEVKDSNIYAKILSKVVLSGKKYQLNFMNGYNVVVDEKTFKQVKVNDTVVYDFVKKSISGIYPLAVKNFVYIFDGKYKGSFGEVKSFTEYNGLAKDIAEIDFFTKS